MTQTMLSFLVQYLAPADTRLLKLCKLLIMVLEHRLIRISVHHGHHAMHIYYY
jgi:hypothetical protein